MRVYKKKKLVHTEKIYVGNNYSLYQELVERTLDFNWNGILDLGIRNAMGKGATGANYWIVPPKPPYIFTLGTFSEIENSPNGVFFPCFQEVLELRLKNMNINSAKICN